MNFKIQAPHPAIEGFVQYYVFISIGIEKEWSAISMAPSGCAVLGAVVGDQSFMLKGEEKAEPTPASLLSLAGQLTHFKKLNLFGQRTLVYAVLKPCAPYRFLAVGQQNCSDLLDLLPAKYRPVLHQFEDCQTPQNTLLIMETLLLNLLMSQKVKPQLFKISAVCDFLNQHSHEPIPIKRICRDLGFSKSTLERHFHEFVGIGPKHYHRIVRFNNVLKHIRQQQQLRHWSEVVYRFGYYDQAHFIKDFKLFYWKIPSAYSSNDDLLSSII